MNFSIEVFQKKIVFLSNISRRTPRGSATKITVLCYHRTTSVTQYHNATVCWRSASCPEFDDTFGDLCHQKCAALGFEIVRSRRIQSMWSCPRDWLELHLHLLVIFLCVCLILSIYRGLKSGKRPKFLRQYFLACINYLFAFNKFHKGHRLGVTTVIGILHIKIGLPEQVSELSSTSGSARVSDIESPCKLPGSRSRRSTATLHPFHGSISWPKGRVRKLFFIGGSDNPDKCIRSMYFDQSKLTCMTRFWMINNAVFVGIPPSLLVVIFPVVWFTNLRLSFVTYWLVFSSLGRFSIHYLGWNKNISSLIMGFTVGYQNALEGHTMCLFSAMLSKLGVECTLVWNCGITMWRWLRSIMRAWWDQRVTNAEATQPYAWHGRFLLEKTIYQNCLRWLSHVMGITALHLAFRALFALSGPGRKSAETEQWRGAKE